MKIKKTNFVLLLLITIIPSIVFGQNNQIINDNQKLNNSINFERIILDRTNLTFQFLLNSELIGWFITNSNKSKIPQDIWEKTNKLLLSGINSNPKMPWSIKIKVSDSVLTKRTIKTIDSLKIFPPSYCFLWSIPINKHTNYDYEIVIIERKKSLSKALNGSDILKIKKVYNEINQPELLIDFKKEKYKVLQEITGQNISEFLAIVSGNRFYLYDLIEYEHVNFLQFE